jgi:hypothetical protein
LYIIYFFYKRRNKSDKINIYFINHIKVYLSVEKNDSCNKIYILSWYKLNYPYKFYIIPTFLYNIWYLEIMCLDIFQKGSEKNFSTIKRKGQLGMIKCCSDLSRYRYDRGWCYCTLTTSCGNSVNFSKVGMLVTSNLKSFNQKERNTKHKLK